MAFHEKLQKILFIKEKEKEQVMVEYQESVNEFEQVASKMYSLLTQKETVEEEKRVKLSTGLPVQHMKQVGTYLLRLEQSIQHYQGLVQHARTKMVTIEEKLIEKSVEVKKYEVLQNKRYTRFVEEIKDKENKQMDEVSIQQYMNRGN